MNEVDKLFSDLPTEDKEMQNIFDPEVKPEIPAPEAEVETKSEEDEPRKNRRHRRLEQQLQDEREARIRLEAQLETRSELSKFTEDVGDVPSEWLSIYGGNSPEGIEQAKRAWKLQQDLLDQATTRAKEEALREIEDRNKRSIQEQKQYESFIDSQLESIEDEFNVDVTSDSPAARKARREFLEMVQTLSPKDENGDITGYADFGATWEMYQLKRGQEKSSSTTSRSAG
jgi:hypothetical protein